MTAIPDRLYFKIGDVSDLIGVKPYVLRYWESEFSVLSPEKSRTGQRVYRKSDVEMLFLIKKLLYQERYSIEGAKKRIIELRRSGELKSAKDQTVLEVEIKKQDAVEKTVSGNRKLSELLLELKDLACRPVRQFFA